MAYGDRREKVLQRQVVHQQFIRSHTKEVQRISIAGYETVVLRVSPRIADTEKKMHPILGKRYMAREEEG